MFGTEGKTVILHGKRKDRKPEETPGPGAYSPNKNLVIKQLARAGIGCAPKVAKDYSTRKDVPGYLYMN